MKSMDRKNKPLWGLSMIGLLGISYWLCRYSLFEMHGMKQWPNLLAILSITVIIIATIFRNRIIPVITVIGYLGGFFLAMIFKTYKIDPGGGKLNNAWLIWASVLIFSILIGIVIDFISKHRPKNAKG